MLLNLFVYNHRTRFETCIAMLINPWVSFFTLHLLQFTQLHEYLALNSSDCFYEQPYHCSVARCFLDINHRIGLQRSVKSFEQS